MKDKMSGKMSDKARAKRRMVTVRLPGGELVKLPFEEIDGTEKNTHVIKRRRARYIPP